MLLIALIPARSPVETMRKDCPKRKYFFITLYFFLKSLSFIFFIECYLYKKEFVSFFDNLQLSFTKGIRSFAKEISNTLGLTSPSAASIRLQRATGIKNSYRETVEVLQKKFLSFENIILSQLINASFSFLGTLVSTWS